MTQEVECGYSGVEEGETAIRVFDERESIQSCRERGRILLPLGCDEGEGFTWNGGEKDRYGSVVDGVIGEGC